MQLIHEFARRILMLFRGGHFEAELEEEMRLHRDLREQDQIAEGLAPEEAHYAVSGRFGNPLLLREESRDMWGWNWLEYLLQDLRYGLRQLSRNPGFTAVAVLTLAFGIGINATFFSAIDGLLLRPPANVAAPDRLLSLYQSNADDSLRPVWSYPDYVYYRDHTSAFSGLSAYSPVPVEIGVRGSNDRTFGDVVSGNYFQVLGEKAILGRTILPEDDMQGAPAVVVLSYELWQTRFAGDHGVLGNVIKIDGGLFTVVGVAPKDTTDIGVQMAPAVWMPLSSQASVGWPPGEVGALEDRGTGWLTVLGRLKDGATTRQATANLRIVAGGLGQEYSKLERGRDIKTEPAVALPSFMSGPVSGIVVLLAGLGGMLLLIPCANVASLTLSRSWGRSSEIAVRSALGASRPRILRQLLTESILVGLFAGAIGLVLAFLGAAALPHFKPPISIPVPMDVRPDFRVVGFTVFLALLTPILFGMAPALQLSRTAISSRLGTRTSSGPGRGSKTQRVLLVSEVSISLLLLVGAGLCLRSLRRATNIDPGFETQNILSFAVSPKLSGYTDAEADVFYRRMFERLGAMGGVRSVSLALSMPLTYGGLEENVASSESAGPAQAEMKVGENLVTPEYFSTVGIPIIRGHSFLGNAEDKGSVVINETLSRRLFSGQDPVGQSLKLGAGQQFSSFRIIGVARDSKYHTLGESHVPYFYGLFSPGVEGPSGTTVLVRTSVPPQSVESMIRSQVHALDKNLPITQMETMSEHISSALWLARTMAGLFAALGSAGLILAVIGLYGTVAYSVARRTNEIGIRMALGAERADVFRLVVGEGMLLTLAGVGCGLVFALLLTRFLRTLLYGVSATDPLTLCGVTTLFMLVALAACYIPARRATKVDPMVALRYE